MTEDKSEIKQGIVNFYQKLYTEGGVWHPKLDRVSFRSLSMEDCNLLEQLFSEEEVVTALCSLEGDKAPGPDDFSLALFQQW